jgi:hypothetical protein
MNEQPKVDKKDDNEIDKLLSQRSSRYHKHAKDFIDLFEPSGGTLVFRIPGTDPAQVKTFNNDAILDGELDSLLNARAQLIINAAKYRALIHRGGERSFGYAYAVPCCRNPAG